MMGRVFLTISTDAEPATDLGYLLHKHPGRPQSFDVTMGTAHVFYPEAAPQRCTAALLVEVDPIALVRGRGGPAAEGFSLGQYMNDRPYAASSMLAVALAKVFKTAMAGRCDARPELAAQPIPLAVHLPVLPCRGGSGLAGRLFGPLGWQVDARAIPLDPTVPSWGDAPYVDLQLTGTLRLADALNHLYVLLPVLDDAKHYWVSPDEVDKLIRAGSGWLATHPERELITRRYLAHQAGMTRSALARLAEVDDLDADRLDDAIPPDAISPDATGVDATGVDTVPPDGSDTLARLSSLADQRRDAVLAVLRDGGAHRVADLGCGEGALTAALLADPWFTEIIATDVATRALEVAERRLKLDLLPDSQRARLRLLQSSLTYRDSRLTGLDAAVLMEVIEHLDLPRLPALERSVFGNASPRMVVVTTPNREHNVRFESLPAGTMRHRDHRFEWTRAEFAAWSETVAAEWRYAVRVLGIGPDDAEVGPPTQLAVFSR